MPGLPLGEPDDDESNMRIPIGSWVFEVKITAAGHVLTTKLDAWRRCRKAGANVGIPEHGWRKAHDDVYWRWFTGVRAQQSRYTTEVETT